MEVIAAIVGLIAILAGLVLAFDWIWGCVKMMLDTYKHHPEE